MATCPECDGTGEETDETGRVYTCAICDGYGEVAEAEPEEDEPDNRDWF